MPKIATYDAGLQRLTEEERGADAATRAGRYVGQYRRQEAEDVKAGGVLQAQGIRERGWPFDILALEEGKGSGGSGGGGGGGGGGFKTQGGADRDPFGFNDHGQASRGAGALGSIAQRFHGTPTSPHGKIATREQVNEDGSRYLFYNNGSREIQRADGTVVRSGRGGGISGGGGRGGGQQLPYTLDSNGRFVPAGRDPLNTFNSRAAGAAQAAAEYWSRYNGGAIPTGTADPVDEYGVPIVTHDENGNPFTAAGERDTQGYQPPPPIPGQEYSREDYNAPQPEITSLRNWLNPNSQDEGGDYGGGGSDRYGDDAAAIAERE